MFKTQDARQSNLWLASAGSLLAVALADLFFYDHPLGWSLGGYVLFLTAAVAIIRKDLFSDKAAWVLVPGLVGLGFALVEDTGFLPCLLAALALITLALNQEKDETFILFRWITRLTSFGALGWLQSANDMLNIAYSFLNQPGRPFYWVRRIIWISVLFILCLIFLNLFSEANPILEQWTKHFWDILEKWLQSLKFSRMFFWGFTGIWAWALFRFSGFFTWNREGLPISFPRLKDGVKTEDHSLVLVSLGILNALFATQTLMDLVYLWGGASLPDHMTYSEYAHRGAYPLMVTAILAALIVLAAFTPNGFAEKSPWARGLVYVWIFQNILLVISSIERLNLYVQAYELTRLRIAAGLWMLLVAVGLFSIGFRILSRRSNGWLVNINGLTLVVMLYLCSFANFNGWIATYNVSHCKELGGSGSSLDINYLVDLGSNAIPALEKFRSLATVKNKKFADAEACLQKRKINLLAQIDDWHSWTFLEARIAGRYLSSEDRVYIRSHPDKNKSNYEYYE